MEFLFFLEFNKMHLLEDRFQYVMEDVMVVFGSRVSLEADVVPLVDVVRQRMLLAKLGGLEIKKSAAVVIKLQILLTSAMIPAAASWSRLNWLASVVLEAARPPPSDCPDTILFQLSWVPAMIFSANSLFLGSALNANSLAGFPSGIL